MVCAIGDEKGTILDKISIPTTLPAETMPQLISYFQKFSLAALGIGTFGPADIHPDSATYGHILSSPKKGWANYNILGAFSETLQVPVGFDTDVNAAALGEAVYGCMRDISTGIYITIGTGIGIGVIAERKPLHGMLHPEGGHIFLQKHPSDTFSGGCPYHGDSCFEGLASGPALEKRYGKKAVELADLPEVWELEADYIAKALVSYILLLSPERIVLGGGVMHQKQLFPLIRQKTKQLLNNYVTTKELENMDTYIVPASLADNQGILGSFSLARQAFDRRK